MRHSVCLSLALSAVLFASSGFSAPSGKELHEEMLTTVGIYDDPELAAYIGSLISQIVSVSEMAGEHFTFSLLDSQDVNAFVTEGNYIYVNRGILNYVANEAQLVSILGHEVAHVTQKHVSTMPIKAGSAKFVTWLAAALSGSQEVYQAGMGYANSLLKGHGRNNELEADEAAARYMVELGYDPEEMLGMLTTMKDLETLQKAREAQAGGGRRTYHGIFSSHPRSDMRLRSGVAKAERIETSAAPRDSGEVIFRQMTEGLVWGENFKEKQPDPDRYYDMGRGIRFDYPEGWTHAPDPTTNGVSGQAEDGIARLSMAPQARTPQTAEEFLYNHLNIPPLRDGREIQPARLKGYTGILPGEGGQPDQRIAVVYYKLGAYVFTGEVNEQGKFAEFDEKFLEAIDTFRPVSNRELEGRKPKRIHYVKATSATTFEALGEELHLNLHEVDDMRLINGYYPTGEPKPGQWIKIFVQEPE